jgi:hypothetical protein
MRESGYFEGEKVLKTANKRWWEPGGEDPTACCSEGTSRCGKETSTTFLVYTLTQRIAFIFE